MQTDTPAIGLPTLCYVEDDSLAPALVIVYTASTKEFPKMLIAQEAVYPSDAELGQNKKYTPSKKYG